MRVELHPRPLKQHYAFSIPQDEFYSHLRAVTNIHACMHAYIFSTKEETVLCIQHGRMLLSRTAAMMTRPALENAVGK